MVKTHRDCIDVAILEYLIKDVKASDIFNEIEQLISEMTETIGKIRQNRETNAIGIVVCFLEGFAKL
jgi:abortive infection bacteriophage resistance protein